MKPLVIGLGNDLLGDDAIGVLAARRLKEQVSETADVVETGLHGAALLDLLIGIRQVIILDAIQTGAHPPGTIIELVPGDLEAVQSPSPHFSGLPELESIAAALGLPFPTEMKILAVEVADPYTIGGAMTPAVAEALDELVRRARRQLELWLAA